MKTILVFLFAVFSYVNVFPQFFCEGQEGWRRKVIDYGSVPTNYIPITTGWVDYLPFTDDFNSFDYSKWTKIDTCRPYSTHAIFSNSSENVYVGKGKLYLKAKQLATPIWCEHWDGAQYYNYSTGFICSKYPIRYGYIEIKCKLPANIALSPCFWMFNSTGIYVYPFTGYRYDEIDVFELHDPNDTIYNVTKTLMQNFHHNLHDEDSSYSSLQQNINFTNSFLNQDIFFAVEWLPEELHFYVNGNLTKSVKFAEESEVPYNIKSDFTCTHFLNAMEQYLQISLGVNSLISQYPDVSQGFVIDYIHSYKLVEGYNYEYWPTSFSMNDPEMFKVHQSIRLGGIGKTAIIPTGQNITIWAEEGIILDKGFTVSGSTTFAARNIATTDLFNY
ncbi:MAG TPA: family 16 glycosylhydrolase [Bacteroidales bacterium]|nr:family 16 glycosylhydrolase [Bacteroidales bacterium]